MVSVFHTQTRAGEMLKEVRDKQIYKEKYSNLVDYIEDNFSFSKSTGYNMIKVVEEFSTRLENLGLHKCLELLKLPLPERQELMEEKDIEVI